MRYFVDLAGARGASTQDVLAGTGLAVDAGDGENIWLSLEQLNAFLDNCEHTLGPGWHIDAMLQLELAHHGPLGAAAGSAATLQSALDVVAQYIELRAPYAWLVPHRKSQTLSLSFVETHPLRRHRSMLIETALLSIVRLIEKIRSRPADGLCLKLDTPAPCYADGFSALAPCEVCFDCPATSLDVPLSWLEDVNLMADAALHEVAVQACQSQLQQFVGRSPLEAQLRARLLREVGGAPSLASLAAELHMSSRSLIRKLKVEGTSYQSIVDDVHQHFAKHQLRHTSLTVAQIGYDLGYADPSNFGRAFRAWTGVSPGEYRRQATR